MKYFGFPQREFASLLEGIRSQRSIMEYGHFQRCDVFPKDNVHPKGKVVFNPSILDPIWFWGRAAFVPFLIIHILVDLGGTKNCGSNGK